MGLSSPAAVVKAWEVQPVDEHRTWRSGRMQLGMEPGRYRRWKPRYTTRSSPRKARPAAACRCSWQRASAGGQPAWAG
eukprot:804296-Rhodomonas_salina.1